MFFFLEKKIAFYISTKYYAKPSHHIKEMANSLVPAENNIELVCHICWCQMPSVEHLAQHNASSKHLIRETTRRAIKEAQNKEKCCEICSFIARSAEDYTLHLNGKDHHRRMLIKLSVENAQTERLLNKKTDALHNTERRQLSSTKFWRYGCRSCLELFQTSAEYIRHNVSAPHLTAEVKFRMLNSRYAAESCAFTCRTCLIVLNSKSQYNAHIASDGHKKRVALQKQFLCEMINIEMKQTAEVFEK